MRPVPAFPRFLFFYAAVFAAFGAASPFLPALLQRQGLSPVELGVALACGTATRLVFGPLGGRLADRAARPGAVLAGFVAASALVALCYGPARGLPLLVAVAVGHAAVLAPVTPIADAMAARTAGTAGFRYGWVRGAGSAAFVAAALLAGQLVERYGLAAIIPVNALLLAGAAAAALFLPAPPRAADPAPQPGLLASLRVLLRVPGFAPLMAVAALIGGSHAMHDGFEVIRWHEAGIPHGVAGVLWSLSVLSEVGVFVLAGPVLLDRIGPAAALALSATAGVVRWGAVALTASVPVMALVEPLHGLTFALAHMTAVSLIARLVPAELTATAQAFHATVALGVTGAAATLASGPLYGALGAPAFWLMALMCAAALPLTLRLRLDLTGPSAPFPPAAAPPPAPGSR